MSLSDDRAASEAWARSMAMSVVRNGGDYGIYSDMDTRNAWHAWRACAERCALACDKIAEARPFVPTAQDCAAACREVGQ